MNRRLIKNNWDSAFYRLSLEASKPLEDEPLILRRLSMTQPHDDDEYGSKNVPPDRDEDTVSIENRYSKKIESNHETRFQPNQVTVLEPVDRERQSKSSTDSVTVKNTKKLDRKLSFKNYQAKFKNKSIFRFHPRNRNKIRKLKKVTELGVQLETIELRRGVVPKPAATLRLSSKVSAEKHPAFDKGGYGDLEMTTKNIKAGDLSKESATSNMTSNGTKSHINNPVPKLMNNLQRTDFTPIKVPDSDPFHGKSPLGWLLYSDLETLIIHRSKHGPNLGRELIAVIQPKRFQNHKRSQLRISDKLEHSPPGLSLDNDSGTSNIIDDLEVKNHTKNIDGMETKLLTQYSVESTTFAAEGEFILEVPILDAPLNDLCDTAVMTNAVSTLVFGSITNVSVSICFNVLVSLVSTPLIYGTL